MAEWISVEDRLPEKDGLYLVYTDSQILTNHRMTILEFSKNGVCFNDPFPHPDGSIHKRYRAGFLLKWYPYPEELPEYFIYSQVPVTHWMPLPELPKEDLING